MARNSIEYSFADKTDKARLTADLNRRFAQFFEKVKRRPANVNEGPLGLTAKNAGPNRQNRSRLFAKNLGRIIASLIRFSGSFDLAEEAMQDALHPRAAYVARHRHSRKPRGVDHNRRPPPHPRRTAARPIPPRKEP